jgi:predicted acylesterase/phospholipase RssA
MVLSAGGPDGLAFFGCLRWLEEHGGGMGDLSTLVGCSAGAMVALFVALGMSSAEMVAWAERGVADGTLTDMDPEGFLSFLDTRGLDDGTRIYRALEAAVTARGHPRGLTFLELARATGRRLVVCVTNLDAARSEMLGPETAPDMPVVLAVRMSISVPILFSPVEYRGATYVDGALHDFCPTTNFWEKFVVEDPEGCRDDLEDPPGPPSVLVLCIVGAAGGPQEEGGTAAAEAAAAAEAEGRGGREDDPADWMGRMMRYLAKLSKNVMDKSCHTRIPASGRRGPSEWVAIPSLVASRAANEDEDHPFHFSFKSMRIGLDRGGVEMGVRHGHATMQTHFSV